MKGKTGLSMAVNNPWQRRLRLFFIFKEERRVLLLKKFMDKDLRIMRNWENMGSVPIFLYISSIFLPLQKMWDVSLKVLKEITKKAKCNIARPDPQLPP